MKRVIFFFGAVVIVAGLAALATLRWSESRGPVGKDHDPHDWLHAELQLTNEQHKALEPIEVKFAAQQRRLSEDLRVANRRLAQVMSEEKTYTPRVAAEVATVHRCMGDLQRLSIEHVYEMRTVLSPEQGEKLMRLAREALERSP